MFPFRDYRISFAFWTLLGTTVWAFSQLCGAKQSIWVKHSLSEAFIPFSKCTLTDTQIRHQTYTLHWEMDHDTKATDLHPALGDGSWHQGNRPAPCTGRWIMTPRQQTYALHWEMDHDTKATDLHPALGDGSWHQGNRPTPCTGRWIMTPRQQTYTLHWEMDHDTKATDLKPVPRDGAWQTRKQIYGLYWKMAHDTKDNRPTTCIGKWHMTSQATDLWSELRDGTCHKRQQTYSLFWEMVHDTKDNDLRPVLENGTWQARQQTFCLNWEMAYDTKDSRPTACTGRWHLTQKTADMQPVLVLVLRSVLENGKCHTHNRPTCMHWAAE